MKVFIYSYKKGSKSAKALAIRLGELLGKKVLRIDDKWPGRIGPTTVINWGSSKNFLNGVWNGVASIAGNKLEAFKVMEGKCNVPLFTISKDVCAGWDIIVCRTLLTGHSGAGIVLVSKGEAIPDAPLYVKYILKKTEYRVHVAFGEVIDVQQKKQRADIPKEQVNFKVRNHQNGWVYCREDIRITDDLKDQAIKACDALGLDFGAVDIIYNQHENMYYVLEVNTAPGLEGQTVESYAQAFYRKLT